MLETVQLSSFPPLTRYKVLVGIIVIQQGSLIARMTGPHQIVEADAGKDDPGHSRWPLT
jgi:hypothetical protein